jgi:hypothetical protein
MDVKPENQVPALNPGPTRSDGGRQSSGSDAHGYFGSVFAARRALFLARGRVGHEAHLADSHLPHNREHFDHRAVGHGLVRVHIDLVGLLHLGIIL